MRKLLPSLVLTSVLVLTACSSPDDDKDAVQQGQQAEPAESQSQSVIGTWKQEDSASEDGWMEPALLIASSLWNGRLIMARIARSTGYDPDLTDSLLEKIKQGGTASGAVAYELDDEATPVELVATDNFGQSEIGRQKFELDSSDKK